MKPIFVMWAVALAAVIASQSSGGVLSNDLFLARTPLTTFPAICVGDNSGATLEPGEAVPDDRYAASVWFSWTAPVSMAVQIDVSAGEFDAALAVWTNASLDELELVAHNDDFGGSRQSAVFIDVVAGTVYQIAAYGVNGATGPFTLRITNDATARIEGRIAGPDHEPLAGIKVAARSQDGDDWACNQLAFTDSAGEYSLRGLTGGTYRLEFKDWTGDYLYEVYEDAFDLSAGTDVALEPPVFTATIDAVLGIASKISGVVTGADSQRLADVLVAAYRLEGDEWVLAQIAQTDSAGYYRLGGLREGTYRVSFEDWAGVYLPEWHENAGDLAAGTDIIVLEAGHVENIDAELSLAATIGGTVQDEVSHLPLSGIQVTAYRWDETQSGWVWSGMGATDFDGMFVVAGLEGGTYRLMIADAENNRYVSEVFDGASDLDSGTDIPVEAGESVLNVAVQLAVHATISGTVRQANGLEGLAGIQVYAYVWDGAEWTIASATETGELGSYELVGLLAGTYRVGFFDPAEFFAAEIFDDRIWLGESIWGDDVTVGPATHVGGIDAELAYVPGQVVHLTCKDQNQMELEFVGAIGRTYVLQAATAVTGVWHDVGETVTLFGSTNTWTDNAVEPRLFWRVKYADFP